jgi:lipopolysaccharide transport system permease protein
MVMNKEKEWDLILKPQSSWYLIDVKALWKYRDLIMLLVRRDFVQVYKQTILGPLWLFVQPVITSLMFTLIFGKLAKISTDGTPTLLFYMAGITLWTYFADCLTKTSSTFLMNAGVFGKVYFPRLVVPISVLISNLVKLAIQMSLFFALWVYYLMKGDSIQPHWMLLWLLPVLVAMMAFLGFGFGILISSLTTKYRDFIFLLGFGVQLLMYASPVVYPMSIMPERLKFWAMMNPLSSILEAFKYILLGHGDFSWMALSSSGSFIIVLTVVAILVFNQVEKNFMDTV